MKVRMKRTLRDEKTGELLRRRGVVDVTKARAKLFIDHGYADPVEEDAQAKGSALKDGGDTGGDGPREK